MGMTNCFSPPVKRPFGETRHSHGASSTVSLSFPNSVRLPELSLNVSRLDLITAHWRGQLVMLSQAQDQPAGLRDWESAITNPVIRLGRVSSGPSARDIWDERRELLSHVFSIVWTLLSRPPCPFCTSPNPRLSISEGFFTHDAPPSLSRCGRGQCPHLQQTVGKLSQEGTKQIHGDRSGPTKKGRGVSGMQLTV